MGRGGKIAVGSAMAVIGIFFLVTGVLGDDMWFMVRRPGVAPPGTVPGMHHWESDPVGYLMAAMMWVLILAVGATLLVQGITGRRPRN
jgi:hypothetical protein